MVIVLPSELSRKEFQVDTRQPSPATGHPPPLAANSPVHEAGLSRFRTSLLHEDEDEQEIYPLLYGKPASLISAIIIDDMA